MLKYYLCITLACVLGMSASLAQNVDTLRNQSIIDLKAAGIGKATLVSMIKNSPCSFDVGVTKIVELKKKGIDDDVISAMIDKMAQKSSTQAISDSASQILEILKKQGTGIYYKKDSASVQELEPTVASQSKQGSTFLTSMTYGIAKTKSKLSVSGDKANLQITDSKPIFYFYFSVEQKNLNEQSNWLSTASNPNEFLLVKFESPKKKSGREMTVGSFNAYEGVSSGVADESRKSFKFRKLSAGLYEVYFETPLPGGEYCFMYAGAGTQNASPKVYDFGVR